MDVPEYQELVRGAFKNIGTGMTMAWLRATDDKPADDRTKAADELLEAFDDFMQAFYAYIAVERMEELETDLDIEGLA